MKSSAKQQFQEFIEKEIKNQPRRNVTLLVIFGALSIPVWQAFTRVMVESIKEGNNNTIELLLFMFIIVVFLTACSFGVNVLTEFMYNNLILNRYKNLKDIMVYVSEHQLKMANGGKEFNNEN